MNIKGYYNRKNNLRYLLYLTGLSSTDLEDFVFDIFGNCRRQLNFAVVFKTNDGKYQNILLRPIFANFPGHNQLRLSL